MKVSERVIAMARIFNIREGFSKKDDWLPERFFKSTRGGPLSNTLLDPNIFKNALELYYEMMGWSKDGVPTKAKLEELDIGWAYDYLK